MQHRLCSLIYILLFSTTVALGGGNLKSPVCNVINTTLPPKEEICFYASELVYDVHYQMTCRIVDPNNKKNGVYIHFYPENIVLNGQEMSGAFKLTQIENIMLVKHVWQGDLFVIRNLDQDDSVEVNCVATPTYRVDL